MCIKLFSIFKIIDIEEKADGIIKCNNLTLINLCLLITGPTNENKLTIILLIIQVSFNEEVNLYIHSTFRRKLCCGQITHYQYPTN